MATHAPPPEAHGPDVTFVGDLGMAVEAAKAAADGKYVNVLGANVAKQCIEAGLLDEILVLVAPVLLGDGTRLIDHAGRTATRLEPLRPDATGPTRLWFRVVR